MHKSGRTLILAFDGTANEFDDTNTNVVKLCAVLQMNDRDIQMVYYQPGIGTYTDPSIRGKIHKWFAKTADLAVAWYLSAHIMCGYEFLMDNHLPGDRIVLMGFSRGAYTARALAGMLHSVGLLPKGNREQVPFAYRIYKSQHELAAKFKETFSKSVEIEMLGVWDTVASVGLIVPQKLPFVSNDTIRAFRHCISLDEHRTKFNVTLWQPEREVTGRFTTQMANREPCVKEMWFAGGHSDVGGGEEGDDSSSSLANISFRWMLHEMQKLDIGITFDNDALDRLQVPVDCVRRVPRSELLTRIRSDDTAVGKEYSTKESKAFSALKTWKQADEEDAKAGLHDELKKQPFWWLLQFPVWTGKRLDFTGTRAFPGDEERGRSEYIHPTVLKRMAFVEGYSPRANLPQNWKALCVDGEAIVRGKCPSIIPYDMTVTMKAGQIGESKSVNQGPAFSHGPMYAGAKLERQMLKTPTILLNAKAWGLKRLVREWLKGCNDNRISFGFPVQEVA